MRMQVKLVKIQSKNYYLMVDKKTINRFKKER